MSLSHFEDPEQQSSGFLFWELSRRYERLVSDALKPLVVRHTEVCCPIGC